MLDLNQLNNLLNSGDKKLEGLTKDEEVIIQGYAFMVTRTLIARAPNTSQGVFDVVLNAFKNGLALGLQSDIVSGKMLERAAK